MSSLTYHTVWVLYCTRVPQLVTDFWRGMGKGGYKKGRCDQWKDVFSCLCSSQMHFLFFFFSFPRASDVVFVYIEGEGSRKCLELAIKAGH